MAIHGAAAALYSAHRGSYAGWLRFARNDGFSQLQIAINRADQTPRECRLFELRSRARAIFASPLENDRRGLMRIFVFRSETRPTLSAFAGDMVGSRLPEKFGPWRLLNTVPRGGALPHDVYRPPVEKAIMLEGFQMFRIKASEPAV